MSFVASLISPSMLHRILGSRKATRSLVDLVAAVQGCLFFPLVGFIKIERAKSDITIGEKASMEAVIIIMLITSRRNMVEENRET